MHLRHHRSLLRAVITALGIVALSQSPAAALAHGGAPASHPNQPRSTSAGLSWSNMNPPSYSFPQPYNENNYGALDSVSCVSATFCVAVGDSLDSFETGLISTWNGRSWIVDTSSPAVLASFFLYGVSCASTSFCVAVGAGYAGNGILTWNGTSWTADPHPPGSSNDTLMGVSCASPSFCVAVDLNGYIITWNGASWTLDDSAPFYEP